MWRCRRENLQQEHAPGFPAWQYLSQARTCKARMDIWEANKILMEIAKPTAPCRVNGIRVHRLRTTPEGELRCEVCGVVAPPVGDPQWIGNW